LADKGLTVSLPSPSGNAAFAAQGAGKPYLSIGFTRIPPSSKRA
jgi:hypothetical protein